MSASFGSMGSDPRSFDEFLARFLHGRQAGAARPIDLTRVLSRRSQQILNAAAAFALEHGHRDVDALHILRVMVDQSPAQEAIRSAGADPTTLVAAVEERLPAADDEGARDEQPALTGSTRRLLLDAYQVARGFGSTYIDPEHIFIALVVNGESPSGQLLQSAGVTPEALQKAAAGEGSAAPSSTGERSTLDTYSVDLTQRARDGKIDPIVGRHGEIEQTIEILSRRTKNNPVLIGEAGVGKTAVVEGLAQRIVDESVPSRLRGKRVVELDVAAMLSGTRYRGDFEERLTSVLDEISAHADSLIVFVDEVHSIVGAGGGGEGGMDAGNILKPRLARGELHLIGATTLTEFRSIEKDAALARRFQPVTVGEPSVEDAVRILEGLRPVYEQHHGVRYSAEALNAAVELSHRYISDRFLPDKAIDLIDQAGARARLSEGEIVDVDSLRTRLAELESEKGEAVEREDYERASSIRDEITRTVAQIDADEGETPEIGLVEIADVVARATGIPAARLGQTDRRRLARIEEELHERVIGQDDAVNVVSRAVRRSRTGMGDERRPIGSFLFLGPTGVGKTELAKSLAASLFGAEEAMVRFDMSEFSERHTVSRLVGSPPGYVGYDEAGQLTERIRRRPYSVILLDEIEKAHPDVFNMLLQVLDDGRLTDGQGRTVDFRNTVVIMTSNLGSDVLASRSGAMGFVAPESTGLGGESDIRARVMSRLREAMRPEFLNRIDEIVMFRKLELPQIRRIVGQILEESRRRLDAQGATLTVADAAVDWIAEHGYEPEYGARPLRRLIQREIDDRVADLLVNEEVREGDGIHVDILEDRLDVRAVSAVPQTA